MRASDPAGEVTMVTTAALSRADDMALRQRRYLATQSVRIVCVVAAVLLPVVLWLKLVLMLGALVLPWLGVVAANAGPARQRTRPTALTGHPEPEVLAPTRLALDPSRTIDMER